MILIKVTTHGQSLTLSGGVIDTFSFYKYVSTFDETNYIIITLFIPCENNKMRMTINFSVVAKYHHIRHL